MKIEIWPIDRPQPYPGNPRRNADAVDKVAALIKEYGWQQPLVVDPAGVVIVGHTRLLAAQKLGLLEVPVVVAGELSPDQCRAYRLADNRSNEDATWDRDRLVVELEALRAADFDLSLTAFSAGELDGFAALAATMRGGLVDDDAVPALEPAPLSVPGDVWLLGEHRVMCGDSTSISAVQRLMGGELAGLVITDPPYNVAYVGKTKAALTIKNDKQTDAAFFSFLSDVYSALFTITADGACIYVFHADSEGANFRRAMTQAGWKLAQCCVWVKQSLVMGRQDYHWQHEPVLFGFKTPAIELAYEPDHEPVLYGWKPTAAHRWFSDRKQSTVWNFDRPSRSAEHPTMKPVALLEYPIGNSSETGDVVVDLFGGSGSTLIACEKQGRRARLMELDPRYCDVIVRRWQAFTGRQALHVDGHSFDSRAVPQAA